MVAVVVSAKGAIGPTIWEVAVLMWRVVWTLISLGDASSTAYYRRRGRIVGDLLIRQSAFIHLQAENLQAWRTRRH